MTAKRIRREVRDLPSRDWDNVVNAMWIMKKLSDADGKRKYGEFFVSYDTMVAKHISAALDPRGDQAHFGPVLGPFHRAWLLELENSLLSIDARIEALPYWDYTRDVAPLSSRYTSIFNDKYFGSYTGQAPDYSVLDGRFARWPISRNGPSHGKHNWRNPYGFLRNPISINKSPYVTRNGGSVCGYPMAIGDPTMWDHCLKVGDSILDWAACVDSKVHGRAHSSIAGSWRRDGQSVDAANCAQWYGVIDPPSSAVWNYNLRGGNSPYPLGTFVSPYALGCFSCPTCELSVNPNSCMCDYATSCGPLWSKLRMSSTLRTGSRFIDTSLMSPLAPASVIGILGDIGDPAGSPNDPM